MYAAKKWERKPGDPVLDADREEDFWKTVYDYLELLIIEGEEYAREIDRRSNQRTRKETG